MERGKAEEPGRKLTEVQKEESMKEGGVRKDADRWEEEAQNGRKRE